MESQKIGQSSFYPCHLRNCGSDRLYYHSQIGKPINIYVIAVSPMDKHGYFSTGGMALYNRDIVKAADIVIVEVNENIPRTFGDSFIHINEVSYLFEENSPRACIGNKGITEEDLMIGKNISELISDGSTIQLGIGAIPNAVAISLKNKKDLGVHTEMLNDGIVELYKSGVINNKKKNFYTDKIITTFTYGSNETYDFIDNNVGILHLDTKYTNSPFIISQNDNMVSVNTTLQVDLMGQCASEAIGTLQISGTGGQVETTTGAKMSKNGKSIIALRSVAMVKDKDGKRQRKSAIVAGHGYGTVITLSRVDIDFLVTEFGVVGLRGMSLRERAEKIISIAHPDFRDELRENAKSMYLI